jgi:hypothetical protein
MLNLRSSLSFLICSTVLFSPAIAFGEAPARPGASAEAEAEPQAATTAEEASSDAASAEAATPAAKQISDGRPFEITDLGMQITPPAGWEMLTNSGSVSLVLQEPKAPVEYDKTMYQRNITVAAAHRASPIDEKRAAELKEQLATSFGKDGLVSEFQVLEHKFFDYRGKNDGLLVYSSMKIGEEPMMQMHILVSGGEKQFLLTYTDLAARFSDQNDKGFDTAWNSMVSIEVSGMTPSRIEGYYKYFALAGGMLFLGLTMFLLRRKASKQDFDGEANALEESEGEAFSHSLMGTLAHGWKLNGASAKVASDGDDFEFSQHAPQTRQTECVSSY